MALIAFVGTACVVNVEVLVFADDIALAVIFVIDTSEQQKKHSAECPNLLFIHSNNQFQYPTRQINSKAHA